MIAVGRLIVAGARALFSPASKSTLTLENGVSLEIVPLNGGPYPEPRPRTIFCVDVHENEYALEEAVRYAHQVFATEPGGEISFIPQLFALVNSYNVSPEQLSVINEELIPAGASIYTYPPGCTKFEEALAELRRELDEARRAYAVARASIKYESPRNRAAGSSASIAVETKV